MGLTCTEVRSFSTRSIRKRARSTVGAFRRTGSRCAVGLGASGAGGSSSRSRPARVGCSCVRRCVRLGPSRTWPRRPRRGRGAAASGAPRPTARTRAGVRTPLAEGRLPEAWISPAHVREWRTRTRLRRTLVDERTGWLVRIQATLFDHGIGGVPDRLLRVRGRAFLAELELPEAARERIEVALAMIDAPRPPARPARARHPGAGAPPGGLPGADAPLRHRAGHRDQHRLRTR
jgi:hypothetical protein